MCMKTINIAHVTPVGLIRKSAVGLGLLITICQIYIDAQNRLRNDKAGPD